jgi:hypothetical protein
MDLNEKYTYWLEHAQYDLDSAGVMYRGWTLALCGIHVPAGG